MTTTVSSLVRQAQHGCCNSNRIENTSQRTAFSSRLLTHAPLQKQETEQPRSVMESTLTSMWPMYQYPLTKLPSLRHSFCSAPPRLQEQRLALQVGAILRFQG